MQERRHGNGKPIALPRSFSRSAADIRCISLAAMQLQGFNVHGMPRGRFQLGISWLDGDISERSGIGGGVAVMSFPELRDRIDVSVCTVLFIFLRASLSSGVLKSRGN